MNVCIVGYGMMGGWHSDALKGTDAVLHTLVGRRADATQEFAELCGYRKWTTDLNSALADPEIDLVILANPSEQHAETALAALNASKHTLVEIPLAMNLADGEAIVAACANAQVRLGVGFLLRWDPRYATVKEKLAAGVLGEPIHISVRRNSPRAKEFPILEYRVPSPGSCQQCPLWVEADALPSLRLS
jgi:2-hydroxy-4-carboxymuconate semialdehyde hemiacetal dehydrogenase